MKIVKIKKMALHYFKGVRSREIEFGDQETVITGPNGCGKSTIMDGFFWCLWGKNAAGMSDTNFLIKTVEPSGEEIANVDHEVSIVLDVDGSEQNFRRVLTPKYTKDGMLKGNTTSYFWNDVPLKQSEYRQKVDEVISEDVFKLIASPYAFIGMPWQEQREALMKMAGDVSDEEVAGDDEALKELIGILTGKTIEEYKREVDAKIKRVNDDMKDIPARIDEVLRSKPEAPDMEALDEQEKMLRQELEDVEKQLSDDAAAVNARNKERIELQREIGELEFQQQKTLNDAEAKVRKEIHSENTKFDAADRAVKLIDSENCEDNNNMALQKKKYESRVEAAESEVKAIDAMLDELRKKWADENASTFSADTELKCPLYGHRCSDGSACQQYDRSQSEAYARFCERKRQTLAEITEKGKRSAETRKEWLNEIGQAEQDYKATVEEYKERFTKRRKQREEYLAVMAEHPRRPLIARNVNGEDIPEWMEMKKRLEELRELLKGMRKYKAEDKTEEKALRATLLNQIAAIGTKRSAQAIIDNADKRIAELEEQLKTLGTEKAKLEYARKTINDFEIAKTTLVGMKVNRMFRIVRWKMFQRQVNGEEVPACICLCNGVSYPNVNTAGQLNAGIDIASALSKAYGVTAPMFIDGAERSGNIYNPHTSQRILLKFEKGVSEMQIIQQ